MNVFLPLRDVTRALGPTSFKLGSHHWDHECQYPDRAAKRLAATAVEVTPELKKGALLLYDYRVMHRGGANATGRATAGRVRDEIQTGLDRHVELPPELDLGRGRGRGRKSLIK